MKKINVMFASGLLAVSAVVGLVGFSLTTKVNATDCSSNAIITCGFSTISQLRTKFNADSPKGTQAIFSYFKLNSAVINGAAYKTGYVTKTGNVVVEGKVVANNAISAGRTNKPGSTAHVVDGTTFYTRTPANSFTSSQLSAIVFFDAQGRFIGAVLHDCGNPVTGTNKVTPPPAPVYSCDQLVASKITRNEYSFTTSTTAKNGATIKSYSYNFGDGTTQVGGATIKHTYAKEGTYTVKSTVTVTVNGKDVVASGSCTVVVTVSPETCPVPGKTHLPKDSPECKEDKPSVMIEKTVNGKEQETVALNTAFKYEIVVKNTGNVVLKNAVVTDKAPANVVFTASDLGNIDNGTWTYTVPELKVGESKSFSITAKLTAYHAGSIVNTVCVETPTVPGGNPDDCDTAAIDTPEAPVTPVTPTTPVELPKTGAAGIIGGGLGLSAIAGALNYYGASRRSLAKAMLKQ